MRLLLLPATMIAVGLAGAVFAQPAPAGPNVATPSLLAPRAPDALSPLAPVQQRQGTDQGVVTAVPLPPPGAAPPPPVAVPPSAAAQVPPGRPAAPSAPPGGAPVSLTPIPLASPRTALPTAKPGTKSSGPVVSTRLPLPSLSPEASPADFLRAARGAVAAGRNGEARSALEMAQTRLLDRAVDAGKESLPSNNLAVKQISDAINALLANDRMACLHYIEFAALTIGTPLD
jgi:hypothetical protein